MILGNKAIKTLLKFVPEELTIAPFHEEQVGPASYDLRLSTSFISPSGPCRVPMCASEILLGPGEFILASTEETITLGLSLCAFIQGRSSWARKGLSIQVAGFVDCGFSGTITLEIFNSSTDDIKLHAGDRIAQAIFHVVTECTIGYGDKPGAKYMRQDGVTMSRG